ncbi:putrescine/spermidine ABC transporter substrate-binding protein [Rhodosalinus halophilus]|uniref:Putrescine-binding periplasmic protein n=1 Tax=Rhodosalinus halophilus TaxID=2259333 RepID=A0A365U5M2_9RHOB|nr:extracellular solute-binding protein [Rhodosalinus halophilus]RBI83692.1 putrescine/spermidine ABC transporter substrate-binding protein [Rhodosalinus halophilus]
MKRLLMTTAALTLSGPALAQELQLYNWGNYTSPEMIEKFEEETGIDVTITDYDSNDTALAKIKAGGHGFDMVVPSATYVPIFIEEGLLMEARPDQMENFEHVAERWRDPEFDPGRRYTVPWQWGTVGMVVDTSVYEGDINTAALFLEPPEELQGKINVIPEMMDVMSIAIYYEGGEQCTQDREVLQKVRDRLLAAKPHWLSIDYGTIEKYAEGDLSAGLYWNGAALRVRLQNPDYAFGYPQTGYPVWSDNLAILADAENVEEAKTFMNFVMEPENAAMLSNFARYANGIAGSEEYMDEVMATAPEVNVPEELAGAGVDSKICPPEAQQIYRAIWTEVLK